MKEVGDRRLGLEGGGGLEDGGSGRKRTAQGEERSMKEKGKRGFA